jgi:hypothetical protein
MSKHKKVWIVASASVLFLVAAAALVQQKYEPIVPAPIVTHDAVATSKHTLRAVFYPTLARGPLASLIKLPEWIVVPLAPREVALLAEPDLNSNSFHLEIFLNERRLGPLIASSVTVGATEAGSGRGKPDLSKDVPFVLWDPRGFVREERGSMLLNGDMPIAPDTVEMLRSLYHPDAPPAPPTLEGNHMFELAVDNRDGGAVAAVLALMSNLDKGPAPFTPAVLAKNLEPVAELHATADFSSDDVIEAKLILKGKPGCETQMESLAFLTEVARDEVAGQLWSQYKLGFAGQTDREGCVVTVTFKIVGLAKVFKGGAGNA